ncbi:MAG: heavy metal-binding domain-containing protein [Acidimicrobiia bacterium]|nr:heavy metal-binding domain-containing protein [Acidimicrobiia bacterium]MDX2465704.1 heavy metal-binding domain-containing protein [Acidimicrobiia bacterium]
MELIRPAGTSSEGSKWTAPAASGETPTGGGGGRDDRFQARSRLDQAMTVAQKRIEAGKQIATSVRTARTPSETEKSEWGSARKPAVETASKPEAKPTETADDSPHVVVDLRPDADRIPGPMPAVRETDYGLGRRWGAEWQRSAQGWVTGADGRATWRPVVTTTPDLANWDVHTYLGVVTAEVAVEAPGGDLRQVGATLARGRQVGIEGLVDEAVERGAHAVVGVTMQYTAIGTRMLLTMSGTAVTLQEKAGTQRS